MLIEFRVLFGVWVWEFGASACEPDDPPRSNDPCAAFTPSFNGTRILLYGYGWVVLSGRFAYDRQHVKHGQNVEAGQEDGTADGQDPI